MTVALALGGGLEVCGLGFGVEALTSMTVALG